MYLTVGYLTVDGVFETIGQECDLLHDRTHGSTNVYCKKREAGAGYQQEM